MLAAGWSSGVPRSIWRKRTFLAFALLWAAESISGEKSDVISCPPGSISSAARYPVSPSPAARSRIVCPGCGWIASTIASDTGMVSRANWSARASQPAAALIQRSRDSRVTSELFHDVVDAGRERLDVLGLDGREHRDPQLVAA